MADENFSRPADLPDTGTTGIGLNSSTKKKCSFCGVKSMKSSAVLFHRFPKNSDMSDKWARISGEKYILNKTPAMRNKSLRVCSLHFNADDYVNKDRKRRLLPSAVPSGINNTGIDIKQMKKSLEESLSSNSLLINDSIVNISPKEPVHTSTPKRNIVTPKTKKIRCLSTKLYYLKRKFNRDLKHKNVESILQSISKLNVVSPVIYNFIASQIKASCVSKYGQRWTVKDKNLALQLYLASPKAYRCLRNFFHLPTKKTLLKTLSGIDLSPGFSEAVLNAIKLVASKLKSHDKYCIVSFDEMKLKTALSYNPKKDIIVGYENFDTYEIQFPRLATHALVFMVRGLCKKWKQVFGVFFSCESAQSSVLKHLLNEGLSKLIESGLSPVAIVCDQGANNQKLYYKELNISNGHPYFFVQGHKIYSLFDAPHLLKCVRNNFKKYSVAFNHNNVRKIALWEHIAFVWNFESQITHRIAPKLTRRHIEVDGLSAMNVRLAAQVLSHSVASALNYLSVLKALPSTAAQTADFCALFNDLFDSVNSRLLKHPSKPMLSAVSLSSAHLQYWEECCAVIETIEFQTKGKKIKFPCLQGWLITLSAFRKMIPELLVNIPYIIMSRFTQDALENFFSLMRNKGGNNDHPTSSDFQCRIRMLIAQHIINTCGHANCEPDDDTVLIPVKVLTDSAACGNGIFTYEDFPSDDPFFENSDSAFQDIPENVFNNEIEMLHCENSAAYVAGYLAKMYFNKTNCTLCQSLLVSNKTLTDSTILLYIKEFKNAKNGLYFPSSSWLYTVCEFGRRFSYLFNIVCRQHNVFKQIVNNLHEIDHSWFSCDSHRTTAWDYMVNLYVRMMLFYKVKYESQNFCNRKRSEKKLKKL